MCPCSFPRTVFRLQVVVLLPRPNSVCYNTQLLRPGNCTRALLESSWSILKSAGPTFTMLGQLSSMQPRQLANVWWAFGTLEFKPTQVCVWAGAGLCVWVCVYVCARAQLGLHL